LHARMLGARKGGVNCGDVESRIVIR
jgi:hypothetical protein